jgi:uncharacterized membrane protein
MATTQYCPTCHQPLPATELATHTRNENAVVAGQHGRQDRVADRITGFAGSLNFVYIHGAWFAVWIAVNAGLFGAALVFDKFPYGLLTMIVSLEAIFLSTFVMVSQNRQAARADVRAELDFETNLRSEVWAVHIGRRLGLDPQQVEAHVRKLVQTSREQLTSTDGVDQESVDPSTA